MSGQRDRARGDGVDNWQRISDAIVDLVKRNPNDAEVLIEVVHLISLQAAYIEFVALNHAQGRIPVMTWEQFAIANIGADNYAKIRKI